MAKQETPTQEEPKAKKELTPDEQKIIDAFLENYHKKFGEEALMEPTPAKPAKSFARRLIDDFKSILPKYVVEEIDKTGRFGEEFLKEAQLSPRPLSSQTFTKIKKPVQENQFPPLPEESGELGQTEITSEDFEELPEFSDQSPQYQKLIDDLTQGAQNLNAGIDIADATHTETQQRNFNTYSKIVPIEPVTPLRVLGDLVKVGAAFALNRNPGLALALSGAGDAIKGYDPSYRDYQHRKNFATTLLEGMSATNLKELEAKLQEPFKRRELETQVKLKGLEAELSKEIAKYREVGENIRSRRVSETAERQVGLKVGRESLLDQIAGLEADSGLVKIELEEINDKDEYEALTQREKVNMAFQNVIKKHHPNQNFNSRAVKKVADDFYKKLAAEVNKK